MTEPNVNLEAKVASLRKEVERLYTVLDSTNAEMESRIQEDVRSEKRRFFSRLNSDQYGRILDLLLDTQKMLRSPECRSLDRKSVV